MGTVYLARRQSSGQMVAIKTLSIEAPEARERFRREIDTLAKIRHPNIIPVIDAGESQGQPYFVMAYIEGGSLEDMVQASLDHHQRVPSFDQTIRYAQDIAEALAELHKLGIYHRDLKPSNILIDAKNQRAVLSDLGLAKWETANLSLDADSLTKSGQLLGTPGFMAPEQISAKEITSIGPWTDVWGFAATFYFTWTSRPPVIGANLMAILGALASNEIPAAREVNPKCPEWLERLCQACLTYDPKKRLKLSQLQSALRTQGREGLPRRRRPWLAMALGMLLLGLIGTGLWHWLQDQSPPRLVLKSSPEIVSEAFVQLEGQVLDSSPKGLWANDSWIPVASDGLFRAKVKLHEGLNSLVLQAEDRAGLKSQKRTVLVTADLSPPQLQWTRCQFRSLKDTDLVTLEGQLSEPGCQIELGGRSLSCPTRQFRIELPLSSIDARASLNVRDQAGHQLRVPMKTVNDKDKLHKLVRSTPANTLFLLRPGHYDCQLTVNRQLAFLGLGRPEEVILQAQHRWLFKGQARELLFSQLSLHQLGTARVGAQFQGHLRIQSCLLKLEGRTGLRLGHTEQPSELTLTDSQLVKPSNCNIINSTVKCLNTRFQRYSGSLQFQGCQRVRFDRCVLDRTSVEFDGQELSLDHCHIKSGSVVVRSGRAHLVGYSHFSDKWPSFKRRTKQGSVSAQSKSYLSIVASDFSKVDTALSLDSGALTQILGSNFSGHTVLFRLEGQARADCLYGHFIPTLADPSGKDFDLPRWWRFNASQSRLHYDRLIKNPSISEPPPLHRPEPILRSLNTLLPKILQGRFTDTELGEIIQELFKLSRCGDVPEGTRAWLIRVILETPNAKIRDQALRALYPLGITRKHWPRFQLALNRVELEQRAIAALKIVSLLGSQGQDLETKVLSMTRAQKATVRAQALRSLIAITGQPSKHQELCYQALQSPHKDERSAALSGLMRINGLKYKEAILKTLSECLKPKQPVPELADLPFMTALQKNDWRQLLKSHPKRARELLLALSLQGQSALPILEALLTEPSLIDNEDVSQALVHCIAAFGYRAQAQLPKLRQWFLQKRREREFLFMWALSQIQGMDSNALKTFKKTRSPVEQEIIQASFKARR